MLSVTVKQTVPQTPRSSLFQGDLGAQEDQVDPWDQAALLDRLRLVGLGTLEGPDHPARDVI